VLLLTLTLALAAAGGTQVPSAATLAAPPRIAGGSAATIRPSESSIIGTIERFEEAARRLTIQTRTGRVAFVLATNATVRMGPHTLALAELPGTHGRKAKVRFTVTNGRRTAHWVAISSEPPRSAGS
jgi:hypothetical protein